ncbi:nucleoside/nucleotide kinase family protein [Pseudonocardia asaccharolytica]|uniref:Nucleoside/nucleotide kinase family protein n=1 Tax=Pseudonocardia asaccharolytica DSM 44247 = NBRC 16224 TaxID=1123024 RepID=A0A511CZU7_9PSEU|nr:nucleoside/nucleotide kinase family protein [Pseudonocardia asaccharolytica]GEL18069.1 nucleoside/nucleotide kinase family protein [Pseudonocardia asaccharolytica DSM 44247 = NBRC 16224]
MTASPPTSTPTLAGLCERARALVGDGRRRVLLGITGSPGAGKSTLVERLCAALEPAPPAGLAAGEWVAPVPMDGFHLADVALERLGLRDRKGAPETFDAGGYRALLRRLRADDEAVVYAPAFERTLEQPLAGAIVVPRAARLVLTEGNYLLVDDEVWRPVAAVLDEVWFCALREDVRLARLVARHVAFGKEPGFARRWVRDVDGPNAMLVAGTARRADLVVPSAVLEEIDGGCRGER